MEIKHDKRQKITKIQKRCKLKQKWCETWQNGYLNANKNYMNERNIKINKMKSRSTHTKKV